MTFTSPAFSDPEAVLRDAEVAFKEPEVVLRDAEAAVKIEAVDSRLMTLASKVPDAAVNTDAVLSRLATLVAKEAEVSAELVIVEISTPLYENDPVNVALCINIGYCVFYKYLGYA